MIIFEIPIVNIYFLINYIKTPNIRVEIVTLAFNFTLISFGFVTLLRTQSTKTKLSILEQLERDIIIHNINENDIKARLQEEYLGQEIGEWLTVKLSLRRLCL
ncbi:MAG: hypothetical protein ACUBOA_12480 [Candidatus Loosdrechtia sp.]|uniref:hypothetical protein n=1 Tax=Candidatus Loosdrechtia sp. TaxID=3101272 RepID=UPI003A672E8A|nr:MAG: hypothetical protein QY305_01925 [Candidatus Jettenia sp. AMX2]